jgi:hypothetical protein
VQFHEKIVKKVWGGFIAKYENNNKSRLGEAAFVRCCL